MAKRKHLTKCGPFWVQGLCNHTGHRLKRWAWCLCAQPEKSCAGGVLEALLYAGKGIPSTGSLVEASGYGESTNVRRHLWVEGNWGSFVPGVCSLWPQGTPVVPTHDANAAQGQSQLYSRHGAWAEDSQGLTWSSPEPWGWIREWKGVVAGPAVICSDLWLPSEATAICRHFWIITPMHVFFLLLKDFL